MDQFPTDVEEGMYTDCEVDRFVDLQCDGGTEIDARAVRDGENVPIVTIDEVGETAIPHE